MISPIFSDGKEYISASRAAKKIGYASDYIGQLCRAKKVPGQLIGRTWYVDFASLTEHKKNRQFGKMKKLVVREYLAPLALEKKIVTSPLLFSLEKSAEIIAQESSKNVIFTYEKDDRPRLPELSKKGRYVEPVWTFALAGQVAALSLALIIATGAGFSTLEHTNPRVASEVRQRIENISEAPKNFVATLSAAFQADVAVGSPTAQLVGAVSFFSGVGTLFDSIVSGFQHLKEIALNKFFFPAVPPSVDYGASIPTERQSPPIAVTEVTKPLDRGPLKSELKTELESYIRLRIDALRSPVVVYSSSPRSGGVNLQLATADFASFKTNEVVPAIYYAVTNQSNSDVDMLASRINTFGNGGTFTNASISNSTFSGSLVGASSLFFDIATGTSATTTSLFSANGTFDTICFSADTCETAWPGAGSSAFAWTPTTWGVSTSTTLGFLNGFLSTASSTFTGGFFANQSTTTSATTTNFFSTTASSTNLRSEEHTSELQSHVNIVCRL